MRDCILDVCSGCSTIDVMEVLYGDHKMTWLRCQNCGKTNSIRYEEVRGHRVRGGVRENRVACAGEIEVSRHVARATFHEEVAGYVGEDRSKLIKLARWAGCGAGTASRWQHGHSAPAPVRRPHVIQWICEQENL